MQKTLAPGAIGIKGLSLQQTIDLAQQTGFDSIVFDIKEAALLADEGGVAHVKDLFAASGVRPGYWGLPVAWRDDEKRDEGLRALPHLAALAQELDCGRAATGLPPYSDDVAYDENFAWHAGRLQPVAAALAAEGVSLGIEFIGPKTLRVGHTYDFIYTLGGVMDIAAAVGTGNIGLLLDIWHLYTSAGSLEDLDSITAKDVVAVHVNDAPAGIPRDEQLDLVRALPLETGVLDLVGFMGKLKTMGYDGPVMPEPFSKRIDDLAATDPLAAARETAASMDALWQAAGLS